jgi:PAS domain S-box-containing protein
MLNLWRIHKHTFMMRALRIRQTMATGEPERSIVSELYHILAVDDDPSQAELVTELLQVSGPFAVEWTDSLHGLWERLPLRSYDAILLDYRLPDGTGLEALDGLRRRGYDTPVVMITGQGDERLAVQAMQLGAKDYLVKGSNELHKLPALIQKTIREHHLERSVHRSVEQIRYQALLLNNVRDAVVVWSREGRITYWNPAADALLGLNGKEFLGKPVEETYLGLFAPHVRVPPADGTSGMEIERYYRKPDGSAIWVSSRVSTLRDFGAGNRLIGYMDVCRDITERKRAEQALVLSRERYALATTAGRVGVWDWNLETGEYYIDPNLKALLGYGDGDIPNQFESWVSHILEEDQKAVIQEAEENIRGLSYEFAIEHRMLHQDGTTRWIAAKGKTIRSNAGKAVRMVGTASDITQRKLMEAQIQAAHAQLTQSARLAAIGELASGVAHHINNPLTTIIAESQLLLQELPADQHAREMAEAIVAAGWRVQRAVAQLIEFSRPATNTITELSINETIQTALDLVGGQFQADATRLEISLQPSLPSMRGNARQLVDLWVNLLMLARDATNDGEAHCIQVRSEQVRQSFIQIDICDDGKPIPANELATMFEPNFLRPPGGRGNGVELNICQEIVRQHGGEICAQSFAERGTMIRVSFPRER